MLQKRAVRIISKAQFNAHTEPLFKKLNILRIKDTLTHQLSTLMWEYDKGLLPVCFADYFQKVSSMHSHNTRFAAKNKLSENVLIKTDTHGKNMLKLFGTRIFNALVDIDLYHLCKTKQSFTKRHKSIY